MKTIHSIGLIAVSGAIIYSVYKTSKAVESVADVAEEVNPLDANNIFNRGITQIVEDTTDGKHSGAGALGSWLYCQFNECL